ncbi:DUF2971 domain-containing protein [Uliginosibacterium aquaticum]|uniref:DUF2971 domain-containing protein n=1 Tax=Uliginosibacterium aquaticum TaxID=2731212 RepID=A0ABX2IJN0_9RHOO|nr:DUF2971 domain-containing protein [Uliginosibacterium aquaticum]NSL57033.1 DUF2971 domain-containing protein [Uliginosibacterium aquaticum]
MKRVPPRLYRYRSLDSLDPVTKEPIVQRIILHGEHYFPSPRQLNDPFECRPLAGFSPKGANTRAHLGALVKRARPDAKPAKRLQLAAQMKRMPRLQRGQMEGVGLLSLSELPDSPLMWAHYADTHRGVCLEFETSKWLFQLAWEVVYQDTYPFVDTANQSYLDIHRTVACTKATYWDYEKEWRIVSYVNNDGSALAKLGLDGQMTGPGLHIAPVETLTGVVFGLDCDSEKQNDVRTWVKDAGLSCSFRKVELDDGQFKFNLVSC